VQLIFISCKCHALQRHARTCEIETAMAAVKNKKYSDVLRPHSEHASKFRGRLKFDRVVERNVNRSVDATSKNKAIKEREIVNERLNIDILY